MVFAAQQAAVRQAAQPAVEPEPAAPPAVQPAADAPAAPAVQAPVMEALPAQAPFQGALAQLRQRLAATRPAEADAAAASPAPAPERAGEAAARLAAQLAGRLVELSSATGAGALTWAVRLAAAMQRGSRPVAWVTPAAESFYPPDAAANGVNLATLAVVRVPDAAAVGRAAERLTRSGGFAGVVLDLGARGRLPPALEGRLAQQALHHGTAVLCLTEKPERAGSLGSLVSLRALAGRRRAAPGAGAGAGNGGEAAPFACTLHVAKDKRRGPGAVHEEACHGPPGLR